uniref:Putative lipocalin-3 1 n=1 Tax=Amblyomma cajennense TaxID=34607 RepID=A0A023FU14_AMBCJ
MALSQCFLLSFVVALFALLIANAEKKITKYEDKDIYKFLNTTDKIWVYNTTEKRRGRTICKYDLKCNISSNGTFFHRVSKERPEELLRGEFLNWSATAPTEYNAMLVFNGSKRAVGLEVLEYASKAYYCAVFTVNLFRRGSPVYRELRVWDRALKKGPGSGCTNKFDQLQRNLNQSAKSHYSRTCQSLPSSMRC